MRRSTLFALVLSVAALAVGIDRLRERALAHLHRVKEQTDVYALPPPPYVKRVALGYDDAVASVLWASTLYQYGEHVGQNRRFPYATQYLQTILHLDPSFRPAYRFMSTLVTMQAVAPERPELDAVRSLLERGIEELPNDGDVWGAYASFMMFEGAQYLPQEEKLAWRTKGAFAAQRAVELGYFMDTINFSGAVYLEQAGHRDLAITQLERAYAVAPNDATRDRIAAKLKRLQGAAALERVSRMQSYFVDRWQREAPFLSEGPFVLIGPKRKVASCAGLAGYSPACEPTWAGALQSAR
jgi:tetratricopeptide (TPR) repeat protein